MANETSYWIHEYIESRKGDWGRSGRNYCEKCCGSGCLSYKYCPWCGRRMIGQKNLTIFRDGDLWDE